MQDNSTIQYRDIPGFIGYKAGSDGSISSCWRHGGRTAGRNNPSCQGSAWRVLKPSRTNSYGHLHVTLVRDGKHYSCRVHRLILSAFVGECPEGCECRHLDGNPTNNAVENLCWGTRKENHADKKRHGTWQGGEQNGNSKLTESQVLALRAEYASGKATHRKLALAFGLSRRTVAQIIHKEMWPHLP